MSSDATFPRLYYAHADVVRDQSRVREDTPALRFYEGGRELACITLSGHIVGREPSPADWAARLTRANNAHDELVATLETVERRFRVYTHDDQAVLNAVRAALAKAKGGV